MFEFTDGPVSSVKTGSCLKAQIQGKRHQSFKEFKHSNPLVYTFFTGKLECTLRKRESI